MMSERRRAKLGDVADVRWGDTSTTKASYVPTGFPAFSASGPDGFLPYADYRRTGVVLSAIGADCGKTWLARSAWSCIKNTIRFWASDPDVDTEYLYWATRDPTFWPRRGSAQPFISQGDARSVVVELPTLYEQRSIASILGALNDKIELNRKMSATLEAMARALFKSWFVDFDPVRAKVDGRDTGLPPEIAALFPDSFEDSELGEIPKSWRVSSLSDVASLNPEAWSRATIPDELHYIDLTSAKWGTIGPAEIFRKEDAPSRAQRILRPRDTIVGIVRPGNGSYAFVAEEGLTGSTGFAVLRPAEPAVALVYLAATRKENIERLAHLADGAAYPAVRPETVLATEVILPRHPGPLLAAFDAFTYPLLDRRGAAARESRILTAIRDALLPKLISGEIRVADAQHSTEKSA